MRFQNFYIFTILILSTFFLACGTTETPANVNGAKTTNANVAIVANENNNPLAPTKAPEAATTNNAPTFTPMVNDFYEALNKKDEAGAKKYLSQSALKYWENEGKSDKKTWLASLSEAEDPTDEKREVRNEKISGDAATAEIKGGSLGVWTPIKFVRENGEWKFASPEDSLSLQNIPQSAPNSNSAK